MEFIKEPHSEKAIENMKWRLPKHLDNDMSRVLNILDKASKLTPKNALTYIDQSLAILAQAKEYCSISGSPFENVLEIYGIFSDIAEDYSNVKEFAERIKYLEGIFDDKGFGEKREKLSLSTVHISKGLEYDYVYIVDLYEGNFPSAKSVEQYEENGDLGGIEEERRLFFVGMTRAKEGLFFVTPLKKWGKNIKPSRFIAEAECILKS